MLSSRFAVLSLALAAVTSTALAVPIVQVDGVFDSNDSYDPGMTLIDSVGESGLDSPQLDIWKVYFQSDDTYYYMGLQVKEPKIDTNGGSTSFVGVTVWACLFSDTGGGALHALGVIMSGSTILLNLDGAFLLPAQYQAAADDGLEVAVLKSVMTMMPPEGPFLFQGQLDDTGAMMDDQISGLVPEPATLAAMALGALVLVRRRR